MRLGSILLLATLCSCGGRQSLDEDGKPDVGLADAAGKSIDAEANLIDGSGPDAPARRCSMGQVTPPQPTSMAAPSVIQARLLQFLSGVVTPAKLPASPAVVTAEWSAATAAQLLDSVADGDAPSGFLHWLTKWYYDEGSATASPARWARIIAQPTATLSNLMSDPNPDSTGGTGYWSDKQLLAGRASIDRRGMLVLEQLLCTPIPRLPPGVTLDPATQMPGQSERDAHRMSIQQPTCAACHSYMDPVGHAFDHFDRMGNYRDLDNGVSVDSSDTFEGALGSKFVFSSIEDLGPQLAQSCEAADCVARALLREAVAPGLSPDADPPFTDDDVAPIAMEFADSNFSFRALVRAIVTSPVFLR